MAILNPSIGKEFLSDTIDNVIIGHSLGGVTASSVFSGNDNVEAMIFLGSYPIKDVKDMDVLYLNAEFDLGMDQEALEGSYKFTSDSLNISIEGGNHAQYGWYGPQKGDGTAEMTTLDQQNIVISQILLFLD